MRALQEERTVCTKEQRQKGASCRWWEGGKQISERPKTRALVKNNEKGETGLVRWGEGRVARRMRAEGERP